MNKIEELARREREDLYQALKELAWLLAASVSANAVLLILVVLADWRTL